ncbi:MAG: ribosome biogenesis GTPase Der [Bacteroidia bacterium]|nr:ribosome biogenesis GTPase Der [Bacteroidia bacterium]MCZ2247690.1 ribosome biogenesis GTPase Der [Bacteroidia bacterium]
MSNIVAIVGRPNVGKSTLFNRLTGTKHAIVDEVSGVTRDRHYGVCEWNGRTFSVIDTGGYAMGSDDVFESEIRKQVELAIVEANLIIFVVDVNQGVHEYDTMVAQLLRKSKKEVIVAVNKVDNSERHNYLGEFYKFGLSELFPISSTSGGGTGELLDEVVKHLKPDSEVSETEEDLPKIAIVGRPNVGKSSLLNALLGEERNIVTPIAGTTRDTINRRYKAFGNDFILVDTAGIRKKGKVHDDLEFYSVMRSIRAIETADVCLLMIDAQEGFESQDVNLFHLIEKNHKGVVILVNKWDLIEKDNHTTKIFESKIREKIAPFVDVPIIFTSVSKKQRLLKAIETAIRVFNSRRIKIPTRKLNDIMLPILDNNPPPSFKGKYIKIKFVSQLPTHAPSFAFFCNLPQYVKESYKRFVENKLRENFDFNGVPVLVFFRQK